MAKCEFCDKTIKKTDKTMEVCDSINGWHRIHKACSISERVKAAEKEMNGFITDELNKFMSKLM